MGLLTELGTGFENAASSFNQFETLKIISDQSSEMNEERGVKIGDFYLTKAQLSLGKSLQWVILDVFSGFSVWSSDISTGQGKYQGFVSYEKIQEKISSNAIFPIKYGKYKDVSGAIYSDTQALVLYLPLLEEIEVPILFYVSSSKITPFRNLLKKAKIEKIPKNSWVIKEMEKNATILPLFTQIRSIKSVRDQKDNYFFFNIGIKGVPADEFVEVIPREKFEKVVLPYREERQKVLDSLYASSATSNLEDNTEEWGN